MSAEELKRNIKEYFKMEIDKADGPDKVGYILEFNKAICQLIDKIDKKQSEETEGRT